MNTMPTQCEKCGRPIAEKKPIGVTIYKRDGTVLVQTDCATLKEAVVKHKANLSNSDLSGSDLRYSDLRDSDLSGSDLSDVEMFHVLFFGKDGTTRITKKQLPDFLKALGVICDE